MLTKRTKVLGKVNSRDANKMIKVIKVNSRDADKMFAIRLGFICEL